MPRISMRDVARAITALNEATDEVESLIEHMKPGEMRDDIVQIIEVSREARRVFARVVRKWQQAQPVTKETQT